MFNAEQLLGKIVGDVLGGGVKKNGGLVDSLSSGSGLMTLIGLGVGAVEILSNQNQQQPAAGKYSGTGSGQAAPASVPPPLPGAPGPPAPPAAAGPPVPPPGSRGDNEQQLTDDALARRMIQVMIAAAHADGGMDLKEQQTILEKLESRGLDDEEKDFLMASLEHPLSMDNLVHGITDPAACRSMYMLAVATVAIDTPEERIWLDDLATRLHISNELKTFIEEQYAQKQ
ncbi:MAG: DUF533 domain-containing protein [Desulfocapsa sp.]|nr:MAG: DUF533 domain-containing protein [Desulfocapsa sp.]